MFWDQDAWGTSLSSNSFSMGLTLYGCCLIGGELFELRVNETVWYLNYLKYVNFVALWVVGHLPTLPHSRYPLPSQLLGLHNFHYA